MDEAIGQGSSADDRVEAEVFVRVFDDGIGLPAHAHAGDAGFDLRSSETLTLRPHQRAIVRTGMAVAIPMGHAGLVLPRSGLASKHGITVANAPGLVDSGYRGELMVALCNTDDSESFTIERGMRIAQLLVIEAPAVRLVRCECLPESEDGRDEGGFGSSGTE